ncbi:hypothetical protein ABW19_dt0208670 [Dactylella cylindrospora]|nr:hypothetical protein ABW19_dt0208670 [Dactylella cylindrospora]
MHPQIINIVTALLLFSLFSSCALSLIISVPARSVITPHSKTIKKSDRFDPTYTTNSHPQPAYTRLRRDENRIKSTEVLHPRATEAENEAPVDISATAEEEPPLPTGDGSAGGNGENGEGNLEGSDTIGEPEENPEELTGEGNEQPDPESTGELVAGETNPSQTTISGDSTAEEPESGNLDPEVTEEHSGLLVTPEDNDGDGIPDEKDSQPDIPNLPSTTSAPKSSPTATNEPEEEEEYEDEDYIPAARNPCNDPSKPFKLDQVYNSTICPPVRHLDHNKNCPLDPRRPGISIGNMTLGSNSSFCQTTTRFHFGAEVPLVNTWCIGPGNCKTGNVTESVLFLPGSSDLDVAAWYGLITNFDNSTRVNISIGNGNRWWNRTISGKYEPVNVTLGYHEISRGPVKDKTDMEQGLEMSLVAGRDSIQDMEGDGTAPMRVSIPEMTEPLKEFECGYWAFYPVLRESCGTISTYLGYANGWVLTWIYTYFEPFCSRSYRQSQRDPASAEGKLVFVKADCQTGKQVLQRPEHRLFFKPGQQRLMRSAMMDGYAEVWKERTMLADFEKGGTGNTTIRDGKMSYVINCAAVSDNNNPELESCLELAQHIGYWEGNKNSFFGNGGAKKFRQLNQNIAMGYNPSCRIRADRNKVAESCTVSDAKVQLYALKIIEKCFNSDSNTPAGKATLTMGDCAIDISVESVLLPKPEQQYCMGTVDDAPDCMPSPVPVAPTPIETATASPVDGTEALPTDSGY